MSWRRDTWDRVSARTHTHTHAFTVIAAAQNVPFLYPLPSSSSSSWCFCLNDDPYKTRKKFFFIIYYIFCHLEMNKTSIIFIKSIMISWICNFHFVKLVAHSFALPSNVFHVHQFRYECWSSGRFSFLYFGYFFPCCFFSLLGFAFFLFCFFFYAICNIFDVVTKTHNILIFLFHYRYRHFRQDEGKLDVGTSCVFFSWQFMWVAQSTFWVNEKTIFRNAFVNFSACINYYFWFWFLLTRLS